MKLTKTFLYTGGDGLWSETSKAVLVEEIGVCSNEEKDFGELLVYFNESTWDNEELGLIYTDEQFIHELRERLQVLGFSEEAVEEIEYSEQGMQGDNYVSCDIGERFISEYEAIAGDLEVI